MQIKKIAVSVVVMNNIESEPLKSPAAIGPKKSENILVTDVQVHCSQNKSSDHPKKKSENILGWNHL